MPIVARYGDRKVRTEALPNARKSAAETPTSRGAGLEEARAQTGQAIAATGSRVAGIGLQLFSELQEQERRRADEVALLNAETRLAKWETARIYDPTKGALTVRGQEAFTLPEQINGEFDTLAGEIQKGLGTDRQRAAFERVKAQRSVSLDATIRRHVYGEMQRYEGQELQSLVENATSTAIANALDPRRVDEELTRAVAAIKTHAPRLGMGPEQIAKQVETVQSATHVGVIERLLANDKTKAAAVYFDEAKEQISGDAMARVEKALEEGGLRATSQQQADTILAAGGTLTEQRDKVKAIDDPKLRDLVEQRIEHEANVREKIDRDRDEATLTSAYNILDKTHDVRSIPVNVWAQLPGNQRASLRAYAEHLVRGVPVQTDLPTYYAMIQQAGEDPETFVKQNLLNYRHKLDEPEFKQLASLQLSLRNGDRNRAEKDLAGFRTHSQILEDTLSLYGIDPKAKPGTPEDKAIAQLRRMLDRRVEAFQETTGKKIGNDDVQQIMDGLLSTSVTVPGSWWNIFPGGKSFSDTPQRLLDLTIQDVPASERSLIEQALRRAGRPVSDATVLDLFIETKSRTRK